jgi:hypothetical protein
MALTVFLAIPGKLWTEYGQKYHQYLLDYQQVPFTTFFEIEKSI